MPRKKKEILALIRRAAEERLTTLDLSHCQLPDFVDQVCTLTHLEDLDLSHCHLTSLPEAIGNLTRLRRLVLRENRLGTLPETVCGLAALEYLDLTLSGVERVSDDVRAWLDRVPTHLVGHTGLAKQLETIPFTMPSHPRGLLAQLKSALEGYGDALSAEDHRADGESIRRRSDESIAGVFANVPELKDVLPEFYDDFVNRRFYSTDQPSEKTLGRNPFRLPTPDDEHWLAEHRGDAGAAAGFGLSPKSDRRVQRVSFLGEGATVPIAAVDYGGVTISNQPYAEDEHYFADFEAQLYRAGPKRFYARVVEHGFGEREIWYASKDGGKTWARMARFLSEFLATQRESWLAVGSIPLGPVDAKGPLN